ARGRGKRTGLHFLTFFSNGNFLFLVVLVRFLVSQVASVYCHSGFDLHLSRLHAVIKNPEELLGLLVIRKAAKKGMLKAHKKNCCSNCV
uniref:Uncharacterized protein n=1 Tax=Oryzias latipes TaxID=8090 RepID=A0A3B3I042_ORYLA